MDMRNVLLAVIVALWAPQVMAEAGIGGLSVAQTNRTVVGLERSLAICAEVTPAYQMDCHAQSFRNAVVRLRNNPAYWEAEVAIHRISRNLRLFARHHSDPDAGRLKKASMRMRAVLKNKIAEGQNMQRMEMEKAIQSMSDVSTQEARHFSLMINVIKHHLDTL